MFIVLEVLHICMSISYISQPYPVIGSRFLWVVSDPTIPCLLSLEPTLCQSELGVGRGQSIFPVRVKSIGHKYMIKTIDTLQIYKSPSQVLLPKFSPIERQCGRVVKCGTRTPGINTASTADYFCELGQTA